MDARLVSPMRPGRDSRLRLLVAGAASAIVVVAGLVAAPTTSATPAVDGGPVVLPGEADIAMTGTADGGQSGYSVAAAGDVNGDGIDDVIVGAFGAASNAGKSYVVFGTATPGPVTLDDSMAAGVGFVITGTGGQSGRAVAGAGDINGDGIDDVIVGAPGANSSKGKSYVVFGTATPGPVTLDDSMAAGVGFVITGTASLGQSGYSVAGAGDVNGDGIDDVIVGAPGVSVFPLGTVGKSYVVFGTATPGPVTLGDGMAAEVGFRITGTAAGGSSGASVAGAGDIDGDGFEDVVIGAPDPFGSVGKSYVVLGSATPGAVTLGDGMAAGVGFAITGTAAGGQSGYSVAGAGDVNGDGKDDVIIGAFGAASNAGKSYVVFGTATPGPVTLNDSMATGVGYVITGTDGQSGRSVAGAGDVNGDGVDDVIVGAPAASGSSGKSYVVFGSTSPGQVTLADDMAGIGFAIIGEFGDSGQRGFSVAGAGDVNGDGRDDVVIGAPTAPLATGSAYAVFGFWTVPGAPGKPTAVAGDAQATVTVTPSASGGPPASFTVTAVQDPAKTCTVTGASGSCTVTGLTNGTAHTFTTTATNPGGTSAASEASDPVTPRAPITPQVVAPGTPGKPTAVAGDGQATVTVTPPTTGGAPGSYTVTGSGSATRADSPGCTVTGATGSCTVTGLTNGTAYTFTTTATNTAGTSAVSEPSDPVTPRSTVRAPQRPTEPLALPATLNPRGWTRVVRVPIRTTAGQTARVRVTCSPARVGLTPAGDVTTCRVVRRAGAIRVWLPGTQGTVVRVRIHAAGTADHRPYTRVRVYRTGPV